MNANGPTDELLLSRFLKGDRDSLAELASRYERRLLGLARGLLDGRRDLACDAVQETWIRVLRYGSSFNGRSSFKTWIYRVAINQCRNIRKSQSRAEIATNSTIESMEPDEDRRAQAPGDEISDIRNALGRLEQQKVDIILLCYHAGLTRKQAADILQIPPGTLKSRLHAALNELRQTLMPEVAS